jgi:hypothetical protein
MNLSLHLIFMEILIMQTCIFSHLMLYLPFADVTYFAILNYVNGILIYDYHRYFRSNIWFKFPFLIIWAIFLPISLCIWATGFHCQI